MRIDLFNQGDSRNKDSRTPHAQDDLFITGQSETNEIVDFTEDANNTFILDVMGNDLGGKSKSLWSLDDVVNSGRNGLVELMSQDAIGSINSSAMGAEISITADGKVAYTYTPALQTELQSLAEGEFALDTFIYSIQLGGGTHSWATATVKITGMNDAPELTGTIINLPAGIEATPYTINASDLLAGFTDVDDDLLSVSNLAVTHGTLTETADGWTFVPDENFSGVVDLSYAVTDGHGGSVQAAQSFIIEPPVDTTAPLLFSSFPWDGSAFKIENNLQLNFDEIVVAGIGNIIISNGSDTRTIDINDASQVTFSSSKLSGLVIINPTEDLTPNTSYNIQIASGVITDTAGNAYAGISDETTLNFTTVSADPLLAWSNPWDESTFKIDNAMQLYFDEMVVAGSGNIIISNGSDTRTIDINDASQVIFDGYSGLMINPTEDLILNTSYNIQLASGVITDSNGNAYAGISDETTLNFTTVSADPLLTWSNPWDESTFKIDNDIQLYFDEMVVAGSGDIIISNGSDTRTIAIDDASQIEFNSSKSKVMINPTEDLVPNTSYNIQIASGVITDADGNAYAGISNETTLNFTTISMDPLLVGSDPWDESINFHISNDLHLYFDEMVMAGNGDIIISNGSDTHTIDINDASQVIFDGYSGVIINPAVDLVPDTSYNIQMSSGVITDALGNAYAGISDSTTLNFTTTDDPAFITMVGFTTTTGLISPDMLVVF